MTTFNKIMTVAFAASFAVACNSAAPEEAVEATDAQEVATPEETSATYMVDTEGDEVMWEGYKVVGGEGHNGTLQVTEGMFAVENGELTGGSFTLDMNSINCLDLASDEEGKGKLEGHLKSVDFFAVDSFPQAMFEITAVKVAENDTTGATHHIDGNLTLRGVTKNITVPAMVTMEDGMIGFETPEFVIDRSQWNVKFRSTSFTEFAEIAKEKVIANNLKLKVNLKAKSA